VRRKPPAWEEAFCEYFAARQLPFMRTAYAIVGSWSTAEDVTQSTFSSLYVYWPKIHGGSVDAYARRVLVNACMASFRSVGRETVTDEPPDAGVCVDTTDHLDLRRALQHLSHRDRAVLALRYLDDLPVHDVAAILQVPPGTVKSQTSRALERLRVVMETSSADKEST